ncbi:MAG: hypothetical protein CMC49_00960 [Flavobacteriaceae bacterium]|nr:hypothetical protein [Flavobacteriaceae bacterium]|tara:strand:+ start:473 stop:2557 length:2085 start_codon:yes stop_codon:yes gene_type:complete
MKNNVADNQVISANLLLSCALEGNYEDFEDLLIPVYQRNYTWEKKEIEELYDDFENHWNRNSKKAEEGEDKGHYVMMEKARRYYLGNIVVVKDGDTQFAILDGQQRITSLYILNAVIRANFKTLEKEIDQLFIKREFNHEEKAELKTTFKSYLKTTEKISLNVGEPRLKILYQSDNDHFKQILREGFKPSSLPDKLSKTHPMIKAYKILQKKLEDSYQDYIKKTYKSDIDEKEVFLAKKHVLSEISNYVRGDWTEFNLTILNKGQEFEIFETMNDRGKDLNAFDLTRNAMISSSLKLDKETQTRVKNLFDKKIKENSKKGESTRYANNAADFMLQSWLLRSSEKISRKKYMGAFINFQSYRKSPKTGFNIKHPGQKENLLNHTVFLEKTSDYHNEILNPEAIKKRKSFGSDNERKNLIKKLKQVDKTGLKQYIPIYMALRLVQCDVGQIIKWLKLIEKIYVNGYLVFSKSPAKFESHLHEAAHKVYLSRKVVKNEYEDYDEIIDHDSKKLDDAYQGLQKSIKEIVGLEKKEYRESFIKLMSNIEISNNKSINYLLSSIELKSRGETGEVKLIDKLTVEHVLPNWYKKNWDKVRFYEEEKETKKLGDNLNGSTVHSQFVNRLGNHTLLTQKWNSELRDAPFNVKKAKILKSELKINHYPNKPISVSFYKDWNAESIEERQKELAKIGFEIWGLNT